MTIRMIVAVDCDNAIGNPDGTLPWKISSDMKRFRDLTIRSTVVMGMTTFLSLNRPDGLPIRKNLILSRSATGPNILETLDALPPEDLWIIGGASVYTQALEAQLVQEIYITRVYLHSGATVSLSHDLFNYETFILEQAALGLNWTAEVQDVAPNAGTPLSDYVTLRKVPNESI